jgi:hypothetical protein
MSHESQSRPPMYTQLEVSAAQSARPAATRDRDDRKQTELLTQILGSVEKQNELLEELVGTLCQQQRQRTQELNQWRAANPALVRQCRRAAETLSRVQTEFLRTMTTEVNSDPESLVDGEFLLTEFVDRFGPRMAHLNGVLQVLAQISGGGTTQG